jgi:Na+/H+ antiporter NhaC
MLAYLLDSGSAPVSTLYPFGAWAIFIAGLLNGYGDISSVEQGLQVYIRAVPYNFYGWFAVILAGLIAYRVFPNFGPMRKAEKRALEQGKVLRDGATPLTGEELDEIKPLEGKKSNILIYLIIPVIIIISIALGTYIVGREAKILEAFFAAVFYLAVAMSIGKHFKGVKDGMEVAVMGIKGVLPAILILALAYCMNAVSKTLGAQDYILSITRNWMTSGLLPVITFLTAGSISFFTGTAWGTYALVTPFVIPIAVSLSGGPVTPIVLITVGALVGGGIFGDHCSPVSDTSFLSSFGAGSDHMDHVITQLPYALLCGLFASVVFGVIGWLVA